MTLRRVDVLVRMLPAEAPLWLELRASKEKAKVPSADRIRQRKAEWEARYRTTEEGTNG